MTSSRTPLLIATCLVLCAGSGLLLGEDDAPDLSVLTKPGTSFVDGDRLVCIGDSITQGGDGPRGFVGLMRAAFQTAGHPAVEVINAGVSGNTVPDVENRMDGILAKRPTVAFIYIGINDVWHHNGDLGAPEHFTTGLRRIISKLQAQGAIVILATPTVIGEKADGSNPLDASLDVFSQISRDMAASLGLELCDLRKAFITYLKAHNSEGKDKGVLTVDGVHLTAAGNALVAQEAAKSLVLGIPRGALAPIIMGSDFTDQTTVQIRFRDTPATMGLSAHITSDGSDPDLSSPVYDKPIPVSVTTTIKARSFKGNTPVSPTVACICAKLPVQKAQHPTATSPGLAYSYYEGDFNRLPDFDALTPLASGIAPRLDLTLRKRDVNYAMRFIGFIDVPTTGLYSLSLASDDGSRLILDGKTIIDADGVHGMSGQTISLGLEAGKHPCTIQYFQGGGDQGLTLEWEQAGGHREAIPASAFCSAAAGK